jgi:long-chain acyl-CoA synthetase
VFDLKGLHTPEYKDVPIQSFDALIQSGRILADQHPSRFAEFVAVRREEDIAVVLLSSGTTGPPRGALLSQGGETSLARLTATTIGLAARDRGYSLLPLAHATARLFDAYAPLVVGSSIAFAEGHDTVARDMVELAPSVIVATPRLLERVKGEVELRMQRAGWLKRTVYRWATRKLAAATTARLAGQRTGSLQARLGDLLVGRFIRDKAGLGRLRYAGIGGAVVSGDLLQWFWAVGVPVRQQYGLTEAGGLISTQRGLEDAGTAGTSLSTDVEVRIDDGELFVRSPGLLVGTLDGGAELEDGWLHTGDLASLDEEGRVIPAGRRAEILVTAGGDEISAPEIESVLKASPYVASAMVVGAGRPAVAAVIELNWDAVADWARSAGVPVTTYAAFAENELVLGLIGRVVGEANTQLAATQNVTAFQILPRPLDEELTPTGKIKRAVVEARHAALIAAMYADPRAGSQ